MRSSKPPRRDIVQPSGKHPYSWSWQPTGIETLQFTSFDDWLKTHGFEYTDAKEERDAAKVNLKDVQVSGGADVRIARQLMASAMNSKEGTTG
jgi:hypothetical protein